MSTWEIILGILILAVSLGIVGAVLKQQAKSKGLSGTISGSGGRDSYYNRTKKPDKEKNLNTLTMILGIILAVLLITMFFVQGAVGNKDNSSTPSVEQTVSDESDDKSEEDKSDISDTVSENETNTSEQESAAE